MHIASRTWSSSIIALAFLDAFFILLFSYGAVTLGIYKIAIIDWVYYIIWITLRVSILTIYPVVSIARANAYVYALQEQFLVAAPEDFSVLGGRDSWLDYLEKVPAMWTLYGVIITWDRLTGLLWAVVTAISAIAISVVSSRSSQSA